MCAISPGAQDLALRFANARATSLSGGRETGYNCKCIIVKLYKDIIQFQKTYTRTYPWLDYHHSRDLPDGLISNTAFADIQRRDINGPYSRKRTNFSPGINLD